MGPEFQEADPAEIDSDWQEFTGGAPVIGIFGEYHAEDVDAIVFQDARGRGLVSWWKDGDRAEIVSLHAEPQGVGIGARIMDEAEKRLRDGGVRRVVLATTNDNIDALRFYVRRGYRLVRVHLNAMDRVRESKPGVPETGLNGLPLRDMWELEKHLPSR